MKMNRSVAMIKANTINEIINVLICCDANLKPCSFAGSIVRGYTLFATDSLIFNFSLIFTLINEKYINLSLLLVSQSHFLFHLYYYFHFLK